MDNPQGRIIQLHNDSQAPFAVVEVESSIDCARCAAGKGCGAGIVGGENRPRQVEARVAANIELHEGDLVSIALHPVDLLEAAATAYGLPLAGGLVFAAAAWLAGAGDLAAAGLTLGGIATGVALGRWRLRRRNCLRRLTPIVTERLGSA